MDAGLFVKGDNDNLIIGDGYPTLCIPQYGGITTNVTTYRAYVSTGGAPFWKTFWRNDTATVSFTTPVTSTEPPMVFAVAGSGARGYLWGYLPVGAPGNWTGFSIRTTGLGGTTSATNNLSAVPTGWKWAVGAFEQPSPNTGFGLKVMGATGKVVFDSRWRIAFLRGLLTNWTIRSALQRSYEINDKNYQDIDFYYSHTIARKVGQSGFLLSQLGSWDELVDEGEASDGLRRQVRFVEMGLEDPASMNRWSIFSRYYHLDHWAPSTSPLNAFRILWIELPVPL